MENIDLSHLDNPNYCKKVINSYKQLNNTLKRNLNYFDGLIKMNINKKGYAKTIILRKAKAYFPIVSESYSRLVNAFRDLFEDDTLEYHTIKKKLQDLISEEHRKRKTGINKENNEFLESLGIRPDLGGVYTDSELHVFGTAFILLDSCRNMMAKLTQIYAMYDNDSYYIEGETEEGFQF